MVKRITNVCVLCINSEDRDEWERMQMVMHDSGTFLLHRKGVALATLAEQACESRLEGLVEDRTTRGLLRDVRRMDFCTAKPRGGGGGGGYGSTAAAASASAKGGARVAEQTHGSCKMVDDGDGLNSGGDGGTSDDTADDDMLGC
jgi:hypothetical protein